MNFTIIDSSYSFKIFLIFDLCIDIHAVQKVRYPLDYQQGAVFSSVVSTYTPIEYINEASRPRSLQKLAGTGKPSTALIVSADNSYTFPVSELYTGAGKITGTAFFDRVHVDNFCRRCWCVWELAKMTRHQKRWHHCWRPPLSGKLRPWSCVLRVSVYGACWEQMREDRGVCLGVLPGAKAPRDDVTMWWNRVDIVPNVPKFSVPG